MPFSVKTNSGIPVFEITGKFLGSIEGPDFKEAVDTQKSAGHPHGVVDLSKADFMDSSGIGVLIGSLTSMRNAGGDLRLAGMTKRIKNLFVVTRLLGSVFEDYDTVDDAVASYND